MFEQYRKKGALSVSFHQQPSGRMIGGQTHSRANPSRGTSDWKNMNYPHCTKCEQRHPRDCSVSPGRCFVCRGGVIDEGTTSIWGKDAITAMKEAIIIRSAPTETLDRHKAIDSQARVTNSLST